MRRLLTASLFLLLTVMSVTSFAAERNLGNWVATILDDFPLKTVLNLDTTQFEKVENEWGHYHYKTKLKSINGNEYNIITFNKDFSQGFIRYHIMGMIGGSNTYIPSTSILVDAKTKKIVQISILFSMIKPFGNGLYRDINFYNRDFDEVLPVLTGRYGEPTENVYMSYEGNRYNGAKFYEARKYAYHLGVFKYNFDTGKEDPKATGYPNYMLIIQAL